MRDLMKPRVIITNPYPFMNFKVGDILERAANTYIKEDSEYHVFASDVKKCTANFRELSWWEFRDESEMPEYLKYPKNGIVFKPYHMDVEFGYYYNNLNDWESQSNSFLSDVIPTTELEYTSYINSKNQ
jgi:hypothetical protein